MCLYFSLNLKRALFVIILFVHAHKVVEQSTHKNGVLLKNRWSFFTKVRLLFLWPELQ